MQPVERTREESGRVLVYDRVEPWKHVARRGVDLTVNLGDSLSGPFDAAATADMLMALDLPTVRGNHDRQLYDRPREDMGLWESWCIDDLSGAHLDWVKSLPLARQIDEVFLCHATPESDEENWLDRRGKQHRLVARDMAAVEERAKGVDASLILCGHTHSARVVRLSDGRMVANPGSVGCPAYLDGRMEPNFIHQTGAPDARYGIAEKTAHGWQVDLISVPYDARRMAALARAKGAESWAEAVTKGWYV